MSLPEPNFIERDPQVIERQVFEAYEAFAEEAASPASPEFLFLKLIAYRETILRIGIQEAAKQNLLRFARFPMIDYLGQLVGVTRLDPQKATTTLEITLPAAHGAPVFVPKGTRRKSNDGRVVFETVADLTIDAGDLTGTVAAKATEPGEIGNGYLSGQVSKEVDPLPNSATAENITTTENGAPRETDERYLQRILLAPESQGSAGSEEGYRYWALTATGAITDVAILSPEPGEIDVVVLTTDGVPSTEVLTLITDTLSPAKRRPMSDTVQALACTEVGWTLDVELTLFADADGEETLATATDAAEAWEAARRAHLGRDVVRSQITRVVGVAGVYDANIISPAASLTVDAEEWANCTGITISIAGYSDERMGTDL